ncbi:hypothetical protein N7470_009933 [Penicillium chermesinum]|nr:hypothetical protein N7470_009933 [Penicillium chermesinum]
MDDDFVPGTFSGVPLNGPSEVAHCSWSHDGTYLAIGFCYLERVEIWNPFTAERISTLWGSIRGHGGVDISWRHDGARLAVLYNTGVIRIWDPLGGQCVSTFIEEDSWTFVDLYRLHETQRNPISWSPDGSWLVSPSRSYGVKVWELKSGTCRYVVKADKLGLSDRMGMQSPAAWPSHKNLLAFGASDFFVIWDPSTNMIICSDVPTEFVVLSRFTDCAVAWPENESEDRVASTHGSAIKIWNPRTGQCEATLEKGRFHVNCIAWSHDEILASASTDGKIRIWRPATAQCVATLTGHNEPVQDLFWLRGGNQLLSNSEDHTAKIWDYRHQKASGFTPGGSCKSTAFLSPDEKRIASGTIVFSGYWMQSTANV